MIHTAVNDMFEQRWIVLMCSDTANNNCSCHISCCGSQYCRVVFKVRKRGEPVLEVTAMRGFIRIMPKLQ